MGTPEGPAPYLQFTKEVALRINIPIENVNRTKSYDLYGSTQAFNDKLQSHVTVDTCTSPCWFLQTIDCTFHSCVLDTINTYVFTQSKVFHIPVTIGLLYIQWNELNGLTIATLNVVLNMKKHVLNNGNVRGQKYRRLVCEVQQEKDLIVKWSKQPEHTLFKKWTEHIVWYLSGEWRCLLRM